MQAEVYACWLIPSIFPYGILQCQLRFLQTQNNVKPLMISTGITSLIHVVACWTLAFRVGFGNKGAALSNAISLEKSRLTSAQFQPNPLKEYVILWSLTPSGHFTINFARKTIRGQPIPRIPLNKTKGENLLPNNSDRKGTEEEPVLSALQNLLDTFRIAAELGSDSLGAYVISMASNWQASDVLAVELLQKDARLAHAGELGRPSPGGT
ncbi:hypothetical protein F0562_007181 [Nyssa sinensis]|uniref:Uncharacterized protein n=1 Tax=Nyssa sinensis TaxID=561372 RepID=A0A5J5A5Q0_9ASTE|nr:hypothetical protein F0562_007181 [Nyssa sinensis]